MFSLKEIDFTKKKNSTFFSSFFFQLFFLRILIASYGARVRGSVFKMKFRVLSREFESIETSPGFAQLLGENWNQSHKKTIIKTRLEKKMSNHKSLELYVFWWHNFCQENWQNERKSWELTVCASPNHSVFRGAKPSCSRIERGSKSFGMVLNYRKVASSNTSRLEAHAGFFRLLMNWIMDPYVLWPFDKKLIS